MRIALFVTCLADTLFPQVGQGDGDAARAARPPGRVPGGADLLRADAREHRLPAGGAAADPALRRGVLRRGRGGRAVGFVRRVGPAPARDGGPAGSATRPLARRAEAVAARTYELSELLTDVLGVEDVGAYYPHRVTYHPTCHSPAGAAGGRPAAAAAAPGGRAGAGGAARGGGLLRVRRHVRGEERRHLDRDAGRQDAPRAVHRGRGVHRRGQLVPDAHRRRAVPAAGRGQDRAPGRDPGLDPGRPDGQPR